MIILHKHGCKTKCRSTSAVSAWLFDVARASCFSVFSGVLLLNFFNQPFNLEHTHEELVDGLFLCWERWLVLRIGWLRLSTFSYTLLLLFLLGPEVPDLARLATTFDALMVYFLRPGFKFGSKLALALIDALCFLSIHLRWFLRNELSEDLSHTSVHPVHSLAASHLFDFTLLLLAFSFFIDATLHHRRSHLG